MPKPRKYELGHFFCRYCNRDIFYQPLFWDSEELRRQKVKHFQLKHRQYMPHGVRGQRSCQSCDMQFESVKELKVHKYNKHGY